MSKRTEQLHIFGMYCANCANRIEKVVGKMEGVSDIQVNLALDSGQVTYNPERTSLDEIINRIDRIGFQASPYERSEKKYVQEAKNLRRNFFFSAILTIPLAWAMLAHLEFFQFVYVPEFLLHPLFQFIIAFPIQFIVGFPFYERAWKGIKHRSLNMDLLVVLSTSAAFFYSHYITFSTITFSNFSEDIVLYYETSAFIITIILFGRYLEARTKAKTRESLENLYKQQMKVATVIDNGKELVTKVDHLKRGDIVLVKPGERVPIDGQVIDGYSYVDESLLTGENVPIEKRVSSNVFAGTINQHGRLIIKVTKKESETMLAHIIKVVEEAQTKKAPIQHIADKITAIFIPIVIFIASITFILSYFYIEPEYFSSAFIKSIAVLIVACPCALGLATPMSMMVASGKGAQLGLLFKEGKYIEQLAKCDVVLLDKTGTITSGTSKVTNMYIEEMDTTTFLQIVRAIEQVSNHPIAKAIVKETKRSKGLTYNVSRVMNIPGHGMKAIVDGKEVIIANLNYFKKEKFTIPHKILKEETRLRQQGKSVSFVFIEGKFTGFIATEDVLKRSNQLAVTSLKEMEKEIILVTGDNEQSSIELSKKLGIDKVYFEQLPEDKVNLVKKLQAEGKTVMMVGDGMNDAPALAVSDVGVAIGTGSDIAIESSDVTLVQGDLERLIKAIRLSEKTLVNIKQNFLWAFLYNMMMIPLAMVGILVPWLASATMALSSLTVVLNSLRLRKVNI